MRLSLAALALVPTLALAQGTPAAQPASAAPTADQKATLQAIEKDLLAERADVISKNLGLTADQAAKFWPVYEKYQAELKVVVDDQLQAITALSNSWQNLDDARAIEFVNATIDRDIAMPTLRKKWLPEFQKVLPGKVAARFMQIDRRLALLTQLEIASKIPLVR